MSSETITRNDLTAILNEVLASAIFTENDDSGWLDISTGIGKYRRKNGHVTVALYKSLAVTGSWATIGSMPSGFRPTGSGGIYFVGIPSSGTGIQLYLSEAGDIQVKAIGNTGTFSICGTVTYPV